MDLSSSETNGDAASQANHKAVFVLQLSQSMKIKIKLPIIVLVYKIGVTFVAKIITTNGCSKHVKIWYNFVT